MSQRQVQQPGDLNRIIIEHLIEISKSEKQNIMRIFIFYSLILLHQWRSRGSTDSRDSISYAGK